MTTSPYNMLTRLPLSLITQKAVRNRLLLVLFFLVLYVLASHKYPYGDWDARAMWNLRAIMIYDRSFTAAYTALPTWAHLDYPPLLPLIIAGGWHIAEPNVPIPAIVHGIIFIIMVWLASKRLWTGFLVGAVALSYGATQSADTAIALLLLAAMLAERQQRRSLAGFLLGLAALTKNEGLLMLVSYALVVSFHDRRLPFDILRGAIIPVILLAIFKLAFPTPNDIMTGTGLLDRLTTLSGYWQIVSYIVPATLQFAAGAVIVFACGLWGFRVRFKPSNALITIIAVWVGYMAIYVITPNDLIWHMTNSYDRLLLQLFPALVCVIAYPLDQRSPRQSETRATPTEQATRA